MQLGAEPYDQERVITCSLVTWELASFHNSTQGTLADLTMASLCHRAREDVSSSVPPVAAEEALRLGKDLLLRGDLDRPGTGMPTALSNLEQL